MVKQTSPVEVFCSYAHKDEVWLHKLIAHLKLLAREGLVLIWHDRLLTGGTDWAQEIDDRLNRANLILNNLANVYRDQKKYEEALPLFEQALAIFQEKLGPAHPDTKIAQKNVEETLQAMKQNAGERGKDAAQT
jgi:tetratricopeptide (TPR) repeat protein